MRRLRWLRARRSAANDVLLAESLEQLRRGDLEVLRPKPACSECIWVDTARSSPGQPNFVCAKTLSDPALQGPCRYLDPGRQA